MVCGNFILPEPASYVSFFALFNLRNLLYLIFYLPVYLIFTFWEFKSIHKGKTAILHLRFGTEKNRRLGSKKARYIRAFRRRHLFLPPHYGMPDWIRTSGLWSRSYQAVKPQTVVAQWFGGCCTNLRHFMRKLQKPCATRLLRFFAVVVK